MRVSNSVIADLQEQIDKIAGESSRLAFGLPEIDERIHGGLALGSPHEVTGGGAAPTCCWRRTGAVDAGIDAGRSGECFDFEVAACDAKWRIESVNYQQDKWRLAK